MKNLCIDTSSKVCSVALLEDDNVIAEKKISDEKTHSENLMPLLDALLNECNLSINEVELISICVGPGSFTGIRIGVAAVKAIAEILNIKVASVTSLEVLAKNYNPDDSEKYTIVPIIDAKNGQVYCGIFDEEKSAKENIFASDIDGAIERIKNYKNVVVVGDGATLYSEKIRSVLSDVKIVDDSEQKASNIGKIGFEKYKNNDLKDADTICPIYLRKSQAERQKEIKEGIKA